jgi:glycerol-3-phosphate O-acyltransferase
MPPTLVATIMLMYRKGISEENLKDKVQWLGTKVVQRGAVLMSDQGLPGSLSVQAGLKHLKGSIMQRNSFYMPKVDGEDYNSYIMLAYYRNPINYIFFNESLVVCSLFSFGIEKTWHSGVDLDLLFERVCFLSDLIKREEVLEHRITKNTRNVFDSVID